MNYHFTFCSECKAQTVHYGTPLSCIRHGKDEVAAWEAEQEAFRKWIAGKSFFELMSLAKDVSARLDYEAVKMETFINRDKFNEFMEHQWKEYPKPA